MAFCGYVMRQAGELYFVLNLQWLASAGSTFYGKRRSYFIIFIIYACELRVLSGSAGHLRLIKIKINQHSHVAAARIS